jgi:hypothetical protein
MGRLYFCTSNETYLTWALGAFTWRTGSQPGSLRNSVALSSPVLSLLAADLAKLIRKPEAAKR